MEPFTLEIKSYNSILKISLPFCILVIVFFYIIKGETDYEQGSKDFPVWIDMMETPGVNLQEAREAFDAYWKHHTHFKGDRSKQFERWYARNEKRLDAYGHVIPHAQVIYEFNKIRSAADFTQQGKWLNYGPINVGPRNGIKKDGGRVKDVEFHPTDSNTYYVSCFKSGMFKTIDAGLTWRPLTDDLPHEVLITKALPSKPSTLFIGTDAGILRSTNSGENWSSIGPNSKTNAILIKADDENVIIAGNDAGIYRSIDGGHSFSFVQAASKTSELRAHPTNPEIMYAGTNGSSSQFFRSTDGGATWVENTTDFGTGAFIKLAVTPAEPNYVYLINSRDHLGDNSFDGVYRSTDSGASFTKRSGTTPCITGYSNSGDLSRGQPNYNLFIVADPTDANTVYAGGIKPWKSIDGGQTWKQVFSDITTDGGSLHVDQLTWAYSPHDHTLFAVNDGGIYYLNNESKFQQITDGLPIAEVWECTQSQQNLTNIAGGTFHCGIKLNKGGTWLSPWGGDESTVLFDYSDDTYAYHFKYDKVHRSSNGGLSFQRINASADRGNYTGTGIVDKSDVNTLFVGLHEVERINNARTANSSTVWDKISSFGDNTDINKIEQSDANHDIMYVSKGSGSFYRSDDVRALSPSFTNLTSNLSGSGKINDIATHPVSENLVYILMGNKVYKSNDKGRSWTDISNGLPTIPLLEIVYDKSSDEGIYIGTDMGVYYKDANMDSWVDYSNGLPVIRVSGMDIFYGPTREESVLTVSTDGRGFWRSALYDVIVNRPVAGFSSNKQSVVANNSINFTDNSTESPMLWEWTFEGGIPEKSNDQNPSVLYEVPGSYKVSLKITGLGGTDSIEFDNYIKVSANTGGTGPLQGHYDFQGNLDDSSSYARDLTIVGGFSPVFTEDRNSNVSGAYQAPGSSGNYLKSSYKGIGGNSERTVTAWIKTTTAGSRKTVVSWGKNSFGAMFNVMVHNGNIRVEGGSCNVQNDDSTVTPLDNDTWRHIAVTYNPEDGDKLSNVKLYIDGVCYTNQPDAGSSYNSELTAINTNNTENDVQIGNASYNSNYYWRGQLDDIRIYSKALSPEEIMTVMSGATVGVDDQESSIENRIKVYPNPFNSKLLLDVPGIGNIRAVIYDLNGKIIQKVIGKTQDNKIEINTQHMTSGNYILSIQFGDQRANKKIIKID